MKRKLASIDVTERAMFSVLGFLGENMRFEGMTTQQAGK